LAWGWRLASCQIWTGFDSIARENVNHRSTEIDQGDTDEIP